MVCYHPINGYRSKEVNSSGKRSIVFTPQKGYLDLPVQIPCGQCIGCRLDKAKEWAVRCVHESRLYDENCFLTLTFNDENIPLGYSLEIDVFQKFMKRLRKFVWKTEKKKIRFFHCGEYGADTSRPHYHAIIFGYDFKDKESISDNNKLCISETLIKLWPFGFSTIGEVTYESCAYVARYITKKITGEKSEEHYQGRKKEYTTMSRRPGIGLNYYEAYKNDIYPLDKIVLLNGKSVKVPRYYADKYILTDEEKARIIKMRKKLKYKDSPDHTFRRLRVRELVAKKNLEKEKRGYENG